MGGTEQQSPLPERAYLYSDQSHSIVLSSGVIRAAAGLRTALECYYRCVLTHKARPRSIAMNEGRR